MLTYQVRKRVFRLSEGDAVDLPNPVEISFVFQPLQPFGVVAGGGKTAVRGVPATAHFDANSGKHTIESKEPLQSLNVTIEEPGRRTEIRGNELRVFTHCKTLKDLNDLIQSLYFGFPMLLNVEFVDPPIVERVSGKAGSTSFRWELAKWRMEFETTTQELQEEKIASSWRRFDLLSKPGNRRLIAALHYFHVGCRLSRVGNSPWEFMPEVILNLSKVLEILFPPVGDGKTRDAVRTALKTLDYSEVEIERDFIPAMALRNEIDVGHVSLSLFTLKQLQILHEYTESAEAAFRSMLRRLLDRMQKGHYEVPLYFDLTPSREAVGVIERLAHYFGGMNRLGLNSAVEHAEQS